MYKLVWNKSLLLVGLFIFLPMVNLFSLSRIDSSERKKSYQKVQEYKQYRDRLDQYIEADNSSIHYLGKIDFTNKKAPQFSQAGVSIKTVFEGNGIDLVLEDSGYRNYYLVFIDNDLPLLLRLRRGKYSYTIARDLTDGPHSIEIFKRTEANCGKTTFWGFALDPGKQIHQAAKYSRNIFFIGDSITAGYGNDRDIPGLIPEQGFNPFYQNHYNAYGAIVSRRLQANYQTVCYSGIGLVRGSSGDPDYNMPDFYRQISHGSKNQWNPADYIPDLIVINLGTNDYASERNGDFLDDKIFQERYTLFVKEIRKDYPNAQIICAVGCMLTDSWPPGRTAKTRLITTVSNMVTEFNNTGDKRVHFLELNVSSPSNGDDSHPNTLNHIEMAKSVEALCRQIMEW